MKTNLNALKRKKKRNTNLKKKRRKKIRHKKQKRNKKDDINNNIEQNNSIRKNEPLFFNADRKTFFLLMRTYYLKELEKTERFLNSQKFLDGNIILTEDEYNYLVAEYNHLLMMENLYLNLEDLFRSLQLQKKITNILKMYLIYKIRHI